jgi:hypothetical protein
MSIPPVDTGSEAYPSTQAAGPDQVTIQGPRFNPALLTQPDTGSQQMPAGLR